MTQTKNSIYKTTSIAVGDSITLVVTDVKAGKDFGRGPTTLYVGTVNGTASTVSPSGNLKFLADDFAQGKKELNKAYTVTRLADKNIKGYNVSQFSVTEASANATAPTSSTPSVADKLAAIRAKRPTNGQSAANS